MFALLMQSAPKYIPLLQHSGGSNKMLVNLMNIKKVTDEFEAMYKD